jgi:hypothetical protein
MMKTTHFSHILSRRYRTAIAVLLIAALVFSGPLTALAGASQEANGLALANADAVKAKILRRMAEEAVYIRAMDQDRLKAALHENLTRALVPVQEAFARAAGLVAGAIGAFDSKDSLQSKIEQALTQAKVEAALTALEARIVALISDRAWATYTAYRARLDAILYEEIEASGLLKPLTTALVDDLKTHISALGHPMPGDVMHGASLDLPHMLPAYSAAAVATLLMVRALLYKRIAAALGLSKIPLFWPVTLTIMFFAALADIDHARTEKIRATQEAIQKVYATLENLVLHEDFTTKLTAVAVAGMEQRLRADMAQVDAALDAFFVGILAQAQSPGYEAFLQHHSPEEGVRMVKKVSTVFGRHLVTEVPFGLKYQLASSLDAARAAALIERHGLPFAELFARHSRPVVQITDNPRYQDILDHVLQSGAPAAELLFYKYSLDRFGALDKAQTDALVLIRQLHPTKRAEDLDKGVLTLLGPAADRLALLARYHPAVAATVVDWTLRRRMDASLLERLAGRADMEVLFRLLTELGPERFAKALAAVDEDTLLRFIDDISPSRGNLDKVVALLRDSPQGYLKAYTHPDAGGARAVRVRHALAREQEGHPLSAAMEQTMLWLLARTGFDERHIRRATLADLRVAGIPDILPDFLALPLARVIVHVGLTPPFLALLLMIALPLLLLWGRFFRFSLPQWRPTRPRGRVIHVPEDQWLKPVGKQEVKSAHVNEGP